MDPRIEVERHMVLHVHPAEECVTCTKRDLRHLVFRDGPAHRNVKRLEDLCPINVIHRHRVGLWDPFGVECEIVGRHGLTGEDIGAALAFFVVKPAAKCIVLHIGRSSRRITGIGNRLLIFSDQFFLLAAVIHEDDLVAFAVIIEFCTVVPRSIFGALCRIAGKAGDRIAVFIRDYRATGSTSVRMVQHIFTCKTLQVVVRFRISLIGFEELLAPQRHSANTCLECRAAWRGGPDSSRPHVADVCAVLGGNANGDDLLVLDILSGKPRSFILNREELHFIHIPLIIDIDDGRAVAVDGLLGDCLRGEALVALCGSTGGCSGRAGFLLAFPEGIFVVVSILLPVDDGVLCGSIARPVGNQRDIARQRASKCEPISTFLVPAFKQETGSGRVDRLVRIAGHKLRRNVAAAVRVKMDPVPLFHSGGQGQRIAASRKIRH